MNWFKKWLCKSEIQQMQDCFKAGHNLKRERDSLKQRVSILEEDNAKKHEELVDERLKHQTTTNSLYGARDELKKLQAKYDAIKPKNLRSKAKS